MLISKSNLLFLVALLAVACTPASHDPAQVEMSDLVGLWDSSITRGSLKDVMYTRIASNGDIIEYDFDGDEADRGLKCYQIDSGSIRSIEKNRFLVTAEMHANRQYEVELESLDDGHALKVYFLDTHDQDNDGDLNETVKSQIWTRIVDDSILKNEPSCKPH